MTKKIDVLLEAQRELGILVDILSKARDIWLVRKAISLSGYRSELTEAIDTEVNNVFKHLAEELKIADAPHDGIVIVVKKKEPEEEVK